MKLKGLVLAGGKSSRMGKDKAMLQYHFIPQYQYVVSLLEKVTDEVYISCRKEQNLIGKCLYDSDSYKEAGPMAGLMSAFEFEPCSWIMIGVDYPNFGLRHIHQLMESRNIENPVSCFENENGFLEPMLGIYEASFFPILKKEYESGQRSLQQILRPLIITRIKASKPSDLKSFDTFEDYSRFKAENHLP